MKRFMCLFLGIIFLLVGCTTTKLSLPETSLILEDIGTSEKLQESVDQGTAIISEDAEGYRTLVSPNNMLTIVRNPKAADYSFYNPSPMTELPNYDPDSGEMWQMDLRSSNLTILDLSQRINDLLNADFDSKTQWPDKLPDGFDPHMIMELGKNPGLGVRELHEKGITGKGIGLAIIDQGLFVEHVEYKDQLKLYEEIHCVDEIATMHGPAVASIAVGKTVGVAPESDLYYIAETHGVYNDEGEFDWDISWIAKSIDRIVEVNSILREGEKIRVISISLGIGEMLNGYEKVVESIEKAQEEGIYTVHVGSNGYLGNGYLGLGRDPLKSADDITAYTKGAFWKEKNYYNNELLVPMDSRCTASPTGPNDYVFYREGGMSWSVPYVAGLYALACQVNPDITPDVFWREALNTSETVPINNINQEKQLKNVNPARVRDNSNQYKLGKIVNPVKLIEKIASIK